MRGLERRLAARPAVSRRPGRRSARDAGEKAWLTPTYPWPSPKFLEKYKREWGDGGALV